MLRFEAESRVPVKPAAVCVCHPLVEQLTGIELQPRFGRRDKEPAARLAIVELRGGLEIVPAGRQRKGMVVTLASPQLFVLGQGASAQPYGCPEIERRSVDGSDLADR